MSLYIGRVYARTVVILLLVGIQLGSDVFQHPLYSGRLHEHTTKEYRWPSTIEKKVIREQTRARSVALTGKDRQRIDGKRLYVVSIGLDDSQIVAVNRE
jgi:hypothetical protein